MQMAAILFCGGSTSQYKGRGTWWQQAAVTSGVNLEPTIKADTWCQPCYSDIWCHATFSLIGHINAAVTSGANI